MTLAPIALAAAVALAGTASAQFAVPWESLDNGAAISSGARFTLAGSLGQHDAGPPDAPMAGPVYSLRGGFWQTPVAAFDPRCNAADIEPPFGVLDLADITGFSIAFVTQNDDADIAEPFGILDLADLLRFIEVFLAGCP